MNKTAEMQSPDTPDGMSSARIMMILERLAEAAEPLSHSELAVSLGIAKSTLTGLLKSLQRIGYVETVDKRYAPGPRLLALARSLLPRAAQHEQTRKLLMPILEDLAAHTGETITLVVEIGESGNSPGSVMAIAYVESPNPLRFVPEIGNPLAMLGTESGRVIYAFSKRPYPKDTTMTRELAAIRERGYTVNKPSTDLTIIAAPVLNSEGQALASISIFGPSFRMVDPVATIWPLLSAATQAAQQLLQQD